MYKNLLNILRIIILFSLIALITKSNAITIIPNYGQGFEEGTPQRVVFEAKIAEWDTFKCLCYYTVTINVSMEDLGGYYKIKPIYQPGVEYIFGISPLDPEEQIILGITDNFTFDAKGYPTSARIRFNSNPAVNWYWNTQPPVPQNKFDGWTVANHEIAHAVGFTIASQRFANNVIAGPPRRYNLGGGRTVPLTPPTQGTHTDPTLLPNDIMNPSLSAGSRREMSEIVLDILRHAYPTPGKVFGKAIDDTNRDGIPSIYEPPLANILITLTGPLGLPDVPICSTWTDIKGRYSFTQLVRGTYIVKQHLLSPRVQSYPTEPYTIYITEGEGISGLWFASYIQDSSMWQKMRDVSGVSKPVKSGGALCALGDKIYALIGNNTREMAIYDIDNNAWVGIETIPASERTRRPKNVKKGSAICTDGQYIYVIKGGNTKEFWRYDPQRDSWHELDTIMYLSKGIRGGSMAYDGNNYIYIISGSNNPEWVRFNIDSLKYEPCDPPKLPPSPDAKWKIGSWIVYVPESSAIYALRVGARNKNEFWMIKRDGTYYEKESMPAIGSSRRRKWAKEGSAGTYNSDNKLIYALKGGNTREFFYYDPALDTWYTLDSIPSRNKVRGGGSLTYSNYANALFAFIGNNTYEFWRYTPETFMTIASSGNIEAQVETKSLKNFTLKINQFKDYLKISYNLPVNIKASLEIYNILGELIYNASTDKGYFTINTKNFANGIYIMRFNADKYKATKKLIIY